MIKGAAPYLERRALRPPRRALLLGVAAQADFESKS